MAYKLGFECKNNMVEYEALILGLKAVVALKIKDIEIYEDSRLIINQVQDFFDTKAKKLKPYRIMVIDLLDQFDRYTIQNIPRTNNTYTDAMASANSLAPIEIEDEETILKIHKLSSPSYMDHMHQIQTCLII